MIQLVDDTTTKSQLVDDCYPLWSTMNHGAHGYHWGDHNGFHWDQPPASESLGANSAPLGFTQQIVDVNMISTYVIYM